MLFDNRLENLTNKDELALTKRYRIVNAGCYSIQTMYCISLYCIVSYCFVLIVLFCAALY